MNIIMKIKTNRNLLAKFYKKNYEQDIQNK